MLYVPRNSHRKGENGQDEMHTSSHDTDACTQPSAAVRTLQNTGWDALERKDFEKAIHLSFVNSWLTISKTFIYYKLFNKKTTKFLYNLKQPEKTRSPNLLFRYLDVSSLKGLRFIIPKDHCCSLIKFNLSQGTSTPSRREAGQTNRGK